MKTIDLKMARYLFVAALATKGIATPDAGRPDHGQKFSIADGKAYGRWILSLADRGRIIEVGRVTSEAPSRHRGLTRLWAAADRPFLRLLAASLKPSAAVQDDLFGEEAAA